MQISTLWWTGSNIFKQRFAVANFIPGNVHNSPVANLAECWLLARWCIRIGHNQCIESVSFRIVFDGWNVFDLRWR